MITIKNSSELQFYINLLEDYNERKYTDYELLRKELLIEFGVKVDRQQLNELFEPSLTESVEDLRIMCRDLF